VRRLATLLSIVTLALAGTAAAVSAPAGAATTPPTALAKVKVVGAVGQAPTLKFAKPFAVKTSVHQVAIPGTGAVLTTGQHVTFNYVLVDGRTGKSVETSFGTGKKPASLSLDTKTTPSPFVKGLVGATIGSRVVVAIAPKDGIAKNLKAPGVKQNDTLLFVLDVMSASTPLARATGEPVTPAAGLPAVTLDAATGKPSIKVPTATAPTQLVVQPLIKGAGPVVAAGQTITVHYTGVIWASGKQFDSSWDRGAAASFSIGTGGVIKGWDTGLVGQTVGSQILLVIPPDQGYGTSGQSSAGISGTDTLVFVVDILDAS
jgi:peptidylprolyl isomerase